MPETDQGMAGPHLLIDCGKLQMKTDKLPKKDKYKKQYKAAAESRKRLESDLKAGVLDHWDDRRITANSSVHSSSSYRRNVVSPFSNNLSRNNSVPMGMTHQQPPLFLQGGFSSNHGTTSKFGSSSVHSDFSQSGTRSMLDGSVSLSRKVLEAQRKAEECYAKYTFSLTKSLIKFVNKEETSSREDERTPENVLMCPLNVVFSLDNFVNVSPKVNVS